MSQHKVTIATENGANFQAIYLDGRLIGDIGDNLSRQDMSFEPVMDVLERLFDQPEFEGFELVHEYRYQKGFRTWTDYGWEYDAEWPEDLSEAPLIPQEDLGFGGPCCTDLFGMPVPCDHDDLRTDGPDRPDGGSADESQID